ncbi:MAG: SDR family NAD(P)-dependent oxidoreductase [Blastocatellales bacterium]
MSEWKGKTVLVTGASYGIGEAFARKLAADGANVIITARSRDRLDTLATELRSRHGANVTALEADLANPSAPRQIFDETEGRGVQIDLLINNAGFGAVGDFADIPLERQIEMIQVNVTALVALSHLFLQPMIKRRAGAIIQVASTASFQGVPYSSIYSATKAFILNFAEGLWAEGREYGVRVLALCPGPTATHFQAVAGTSHLRDPEKMQKPEEVVEAGLKALAKNRSVAISGFGNKLMIGAERLAPRNLVTRFAAKLYKPFSTRGAQTR